MAEPYVINNDCSKASFDYIYRLMTMPRYLDRDTIPAPNSAEDNKKNFSTQNEE